MSVTILLRLHIFLSLEAESLILKTEHALLSQVFEFSLLLTQFLPFPHFIFHAFFCQFFILSISPLWSPFCLNEGELVGFKYPSPGQSLQSERWWWEPWLIPLQKAVCTELLQGCSVLLFPTHCGFSEFTQLVILWWNSRLRWITGVCTDSPQGCQPDKSHRELSSGA